VADVQAAESQQRLAYTTVLTMLRILEQKGAVKRELEGRAHVYYPAFEQDEAARTAVRDVVQSFFANSKTALAMRLIAEEKPDGEELARIKELIAGYEEEAQ
jgi:predicted transcriptional regulator